MIYFYKLNALKITHFVKANLLGAILNITKFYYVMRDFMSYVSLAYYSIRFNLRSQVQMAIKDIINIRHKR